MPRASAKRVSKAQWAKMSSAQRAALKRSLGIPTISGKGAYKVKSKAPKSKKSYSYGRPGPFGKVGRSLGGMAGGYLGGPVGAALGSAVGGLGHYIGKIFGSGDYVSSPPVEQNTVLSPQVPSFSNGGTTIRVRHREYLGDVYSSATANTFDINSYRINPGLVASFPWLSQVCGSTFQQYRLNGMVFEYRSMSGDALTSNNTALGTVVMCTDYDSADAPFTSKQQMENTEFGVSCKPSSNMIHAIECAPQLTSVSEKYIRAYANPPGTDIRLYDMGRFYIATNGFQGTSVNCGELWVSYDVTLIKAIEQFPLYLDPVAQYTLNAVDATHAIGTSQTVVLDQIGVSFVYDSGTSYVKLPSTLQANSLWQVTYVVHGASTALVATVDIQPQSGGLTQYGGEVVSPLTATATQAARSWSGVFKYDGSALPSAPPTFTISGGVVPTAITVSKISIAQVSSLLPADGEIQP